MFKNPVDEHTRQILYTISPFCPPQLPILKNLVPASKCFKNACTKLWLIFVVFLPFCLTWRWPLDQYVIETRKSVFGNSILQKFHLCQLALIANARSNIQFLLQNTQLSQIFVLPYQDGVDNLTKIYSTLKPNIYIISFVPGSAPYFLHSEPNLIKSLETNIEKRETDSIGCSKQNKFTL